MKILGILGNVFLALGALCLISFVLMFWAIPFLGLGALFKIAASFSDRSMLPPGSGRWR